MTAPPRPSPDRPPRPRRTRRLGRVAATVLLVLRFVRAVVVAGLQIMTIILRQRPGGGPAVDLQSHFVRLRYAPMRPQGVAFLASLVSLTPGSTVVAIDAKRREMVLHLLDSRSAQATIDDVRRDFEPPLVAWFGLEDRA